MLALEIPLDPTGLDAAQDNVAAYLAAHEVTERARYKVRLVLDELVANLMMHGRFVGEMLPARVEVVVGKDAVSLAFEDAAEPFDPRLVAPPAEPPSLDDDRVGGLGLALVRRMAEIGDYRRLPEGWNRTELGIRDA